MQHQQQRGSGPTASSCYGTARARGTATIGESVERAAMAWSNWGENKGMPMMANLFQSIPSQVHWLDGRAPYNQGRGGGQPGGQPDETRRCPARPRLHLVPETVGMEGRRRRRSVLFCLNLTRRSLTLWLCDPRAVKTAWLAMAGMGKEYLPETRAWQLNERMYGLAGLTPQEAYAKYVR